MNPLLTTKAESFRSGSDNLEFYHNRLVKLTKPQTTKVPQTQPPLPVPIEEERYMDIGRSLSHNGSDYRSEEHTSDSSHSH